MSNYAFMTWKISAAYIDEYADIQTLYIMQCKLLLTAEPLCGENMRKWSCFIPLIVRSEPREVSTVRQSLFTYYLIAKNITNFSKIKRNRMF